MESRSLTNASLKPFLEQNLRKEFNPWPAESWDFEMLTLAAFYYNPSLDVARAQWAVAEAGKVTAGGRPNPTLNVTPGYNVTTLTPSPWIPLGSLDIPIETAGKRGYRRAQAAHLSEAARLNIASVAWHIRSELRSAFLDFVAAERRESLLQSQLSLQERLVQRLDQQVQAGEIASSEALTFRVALSKARLDLADAQRQRAEVRARLAEVIGIPARALDNVKLAFDLQHDPASVADLTSAEVRRIALQTRADILESLAEYAAAQSALQLEIAKQYPDVHLQPGYEFDQGDSKWSLGLTVDLPILNQNQGPIAEAKARRAEAAARFNALQAKVLAEIERAVEVFRTAEKTSVTLRSLAEEQAKRRDAVEAQFKAGAADQGDVLGAQLESATADLVQLDSQVRLQQAIGALEDAVQRPLTVPESVFRSKPDHAR